ncbi:hypothetical protein IID26_00105 [Patescibacteria group bacterium]|nr:hypothetical protein [Patescibacteria group bacterium]
MLFVLFVIALFASTTTFADDRYKPSAPNQEQSQKQKQKQGQKQSQSAKAVAKSTAYGGSATVDIHNKNVNKNDIDIHNKNVNKNDIDIKNKNVNKNDNSNTVNVEGSSATATGGSVNIADGAIRTGDQSVTVNDGDVSLTTGDVNVSTGDVNVAPTQTVTFVSPEPLPGILHVSTPFLPEPQLFNESVDAAEGGIRLAEWFNSECEQQYTRGKPLIPEEGKVGGTRIVFVPHQNLVAKARKSRADTVRFLLPEGSQKCLGIVTAESESKKINPLGAIQADVAKYVLRYVKGVGEINLVAMPESVTANRSVTTGGRGLNLLTSISKAFSSERSVAGFGGGGAITDGKSFTRALLGNTWIVATPDPGGIPIKFKPKKVSETEEEMPEAPPTEEVAKAPDPTSPPVADTIILDRGPNDFGLRQIEYVTP